MRSSDDLWVEYPLDHEDEMAPGESVQIPVFDAKKTIKMSQKWMVLQKHTRIVVYFISDGKELNLKFIVTI